MFQALTPWGIGGSLVPAGTTAQVDLALQRLLAHLVPAAIEFALVLGDVLLGDLVRGMHGPGGEVHEERPIRRQRPVIAIHWMALLVMSVVKW